MAKVARFARSNLVLSLVLLFTFVVFGSLAYYAYKRDIDDGLIERHGGSLTVTIGFGVSQLSHAVSGVGRGVKYLSNLNLVLVRS